MGWSLFEIEAGEASDRDAWSGIRTIESVTGFLRRSAGPSTRGGRESIRSDQAGTSRLSDAEGRGGSDKDGDLSEKGCDGGSAVWVAFTIHTKPRRVVTTYDPNDDVISQARKECGLTSCPPLARMNRGRFDSRQRSPSQRDSVGRIPNSFKEIPLRHLPPYLPTCPAGFCQPPECLSRNPVATLTSSQGPGPFRPRAYNKFHSYEVMCFERRCIGCHAAFDRETS